MKRSYILVIIFLTICSQSLFAQEVIRLQPCHDSLIFRQVDSLKELYGKDGFEVMREASIMMESDYEMPVIIQFQERIMYQIVFIGE